MSNLFNSWYSSLLICPDCGNSLREDQESVKCERCNFDDPTKYNLKPTRSKFKTLQFNTTPITIQDYLSQISFLRPKNIYTGPAALRDSKEFMSLLSLHLDSPSRILDLGCGSRDQFIPINYLGHQYVGVDYSGTKADFLVDAHSIPFQSNSFDCVFSYAVLEHLYNPFIALHEISRVLRPGGIFIGTVSQGEPYHESYFHLTPWGLISLVSSVPSLQIKQLWDSMDTIQALSRIGRYPKVIKLLLALIDKFHTKFPILAPRKMKWTTEEKALDKLYRSGSIAFLITKGS